MNSSLDWFIAKGIRENHEIITRCKRNLKSIAESNKFNIRVEIYWNYNPIDNSGMPSKELEDLMEKMEEVMTIQIENEGIAIHTANFLGNSQHIWVWYCTDLNQFGEKLNSSLKYFPKLPLQIISTNDPDWEDYKDTLNKCNVFYS